MELVNGRPERDEGRLEKEIRCYDLLDSLSVPYQRIDHEEANTMEACAAIDEVLDATICKNLLLCNRQCTAFYLLMIPGDKAVLCNRQCTAFYLLMIPGDKAFRTSELSKKIGSSRLSFARPEYMAEFLDITPGSVSVLGLMNDRENRVQLLIDADVLKGEYFGCHPCINTASLRIRTDDLMKKILPAMHHTAQIVALE